MLLPPLGHTHTIPRCGRYLETQRTAHRLTERCPLPHYPTRNAEEARGRRLLFCVWAPSSFLHHRQLAARRRAARFATTTTMSGKVLLLCSLVVALLLLAAAPARGNAPCSLPINPKGSGSGGAGGRKGPSGPIAHYYQCSGTKAGKAHVSHNAPLASFRQPRESIDKLKGLARGVKGHVGNAVGGVKRKWAEHREARRAANKAAEAERLLVGKGQGEKKKVRKSTRHACLLSL